MGRAMLPFNQMDVPARETIAAAENAYTDARAVRLVDEIVDRMRACVWAVFEGHYLPEHAPGTEPWRFLVTSDMLLYVDARSRGIGHVAAVRQTIYTDY